MTPACTTTDRNAILSVDRWTPDVIEVNPVDHDLTVIIPAYNEANRLPWTLQGLASYLDNWGVDYRVLVADDGSTDCTATLTDHWGPRFSTLRLKRQRGKGRAIKTAMLQATGRVLAFTDADLPFDLKAMRHGYKMITQNNCQVVFGARDLAESKYLAPRRWTRKAATYIFRSINRILVSRHIGDTQCGLKLFSRQAALDLFSRVTIDGFSFDAEVVIWMHRMNISYQRIPVTLINEYDSTLSLRRNALPMLADVLRIWWRARFGHSQPLPQFVYRDEVFVADSRKKAA